MARGQSVRIAQITAQIASTTTMTPAMAATNPMTTLKRIQAATTRTSSAIARLPSEEPEGVEVDMPSRVPRRQTGDCGSRGVSVVRPAQMREAIRRRIGAADGGHASHLVATYPRRCCGVLLAGHRNEDAAGQIGGGGHAIHHQGPCKHRHWPGVADSARGCGP